MATATGITVNRKGASFRGVFDDIWSVTFTLDSPAISGNSSEQSIVAVPGVRIGTDVVLGFTHTVGLDSNVIEEIHVGADNELHVIRHNASGAPVDLASSVFRVVIARLV